MFHKLDTGTITTQSNVPPSGGEDVTVTPTISLRGKSAA